MNITVGWHDTECGGYDADLPLWEELASAAGGPILDVGAGTGRVAIALARAGHDVTALDIEPDLLEELARRAEAAGVTVHTVAADAAGFDLDGREFALIAVPMQTIQLLDARDGFFASARRALAPGGLVALALAEAAEAFAAPDELPSPDVSEHEGWRFVSQPLAIRLRPDAMRIERLRQLTAPGGERSAAEDVIELHLLSARQLGDEAAAHGLTLLPSAHVRATDEHVGSEVVLLRG
jgi:SAM-dependent methyltransferase